MDQPKRSQFSSRETEDQTDQYFTSERTIINCVARFREVAAEVTADTHMYVDFSAGRNLVAKHLGIPYKAYDIDASNVSFGRVTCKDWLSVNPTKFWGFVDATELIIGFNPPFGYRHKLINKFIRHACVANPAYLLLICPLVYSLPSAIASRYEQITAEVLPIDSFERPDGTAFGWPCKFVVFRKVVVTTAVTIPVPVSVPVPRAYVIKLIYNRDHESLPNRALLVRINGACAARQFIIKNGDRFVKYHKGIVVANYSSWSATGIADKRYDSVSFAPRADVNLEALMMSIQHQFVASQGPALGQCSHSINRETLALMIDQYLSSTL